MNAYLRVLCLLSITAVVPSCGETNGPPGTRFPEGVGVPVMVRAWRVSLVRPDNTRRPGWRPPTRNLLALLIRDDRDRLTLLGERNALKWWMVNGTSVERIVTQGGLRVVVVPDPGDELRSAVLWLTPNFDHTDMKLSLYEILQKYHTKVRSGTIPSIPIGDGAELLVPLQGIPLPFASFGDMVRHFRLEAYR